MNSISIYLSKKTVLHLLMIAQDELTWRQEERTGGISDDDIDSLMFALQRKDAQNRIAVTQSQLDWILVELDSLADETIADLEEGV